MFSAKLNIFKIKTQLLLISRYLQIKQQNKLEIPKNTLNFFSKIFGTNCATCKNILEANPALLTLNEHDIVESSETLRSLNYTTVQIQERPNLLSFNGSTLRNRFVILQESGCNEIMHTVLAKYVTIMNREISLLKVNGIIPIDMDVKESLQLIFKDHHIMLKEEVNDNIILQELRKKILNIYLAEELKMSKSDLEKLWKTYNRIRHKSFQSVISMIRLLRKELNFPDDRIIKNGFLLYGDPDNIRRIITEIKTIGNEDVREILIRRPKIAMSNCTSLLKTLENIRLFNIPETAVLKCLEVLTLGPNTILERLQNLNKVEEFKVLYDNPRILRLVHYQTKARARLDYLNQIKVKCASLHLLSAHSDSFEKYVRDGDDKTKGRDLVVFLSKMLKQPRSEIRNLMSRHANWCHIPLLAIKECYEFLLSKRFQPDDIFRNIQILLYPINRISEKLTYLQTPDSFKELHLDIDNSFDVTNSQILGLCLYLIESEFHFTADGIWIDTPIHQIENFNQVLPDFPECLTKDYKFGVKSPTIKLNRAALS